MRLDPWTPSQRVALLVMLSVIVGWLTFRLIHDRVTVPADLPPEGPRAGELLNQLDLNTADADSLSAVPHLGEKKAHDIVEFRDTYFQQHGRSPFDRVEDVLQIKGIGVGTVMQIKPFVFVTTRPTTRP
jgi:hypothetical protein